MTDPAFQAAPPQDTVCIAVCADRYIFGLLTGLLLSLAGRDRARYHIGLIDIGLTDAQRDYLRPLCDAIEPVDDARLVRLDPRVAAGIEAKSPFWRAQACRPFLREYFPGHRGYIHMDADMWVQRPAFLDAVCDVMLDQGKAVIVPELDATYRHYVSFEENLSYMAVKNSVTRQLFGETIERQTGALPYFNTGFFAMRDDLPHWDLFKAYLELANARGYHHVSEQITFNLVLLKLGEFQPFPAQCNWMCSMSAPVRGADGLWHMPTYPYTTIDLLHLTGTDKIARYQPLGLLYDEGRYLEPIASLICPLP